MPKEIHKYLDKRFLAPFEIRSLNLSPDGSKLITYSTNYHKHILSTFDCSSGEHLSDMEFKYDHYDLNLQSNGKELYFSDNKYLDGHRNYFLNSLHLSPQLSVEQLGIEYSAEGYYHDLCFKEDVLLVGNSTQLLIYDRKTKVLLREVKGPYEGNEHGIAISPNGQLVAFANWKTNEIQLYTIADGKFQKSFTAEKVHDQNGCHLSFLPDSKTLFVGAGMSAELWDCNSGKIDKKILISGIYGSTLINFVVSPNGKYIAGFYTGLHLVVFRVADGEQIWLKSHFDGLNSFCFSQDEQTIYYSKGMNIQRFEAASGETISGEVEQLGVAPNKIYKLPDEEVLLAFFGKQAIRMNIENGQTISYLYSGRSPLFAYNKFDPYSAYNLLCCGDYGMQFLNATSGKSRSFISGYYGKMAISSEYVAVSNGYMSNASKKTLDIYSNSGALLRTLAKSLKNIPHYGLTFLSDGLRLLGIGEKNIMLWDAASGNQLWQIPMKGLAYSELSSNEDGTRAIFSNNKQVLICINTENGESCWEYKLLGKKEQNKAKSIFIVGNFVLIVCEAGDLRLLELSTGNELQRTLLYPAGNATACLDGSKLIVVHSDTAIAHYDISDWLQTTAIEVVEKKKTPVASATNIQTSSTADIAGKTVLFTGTLSIPRKEAEEKAKAVGAVIASGVNKKLDYLVVGEDAGSKLDKAKDLGVTIVNEKEFWEMLEPEKQGGIFSIPSEQLNPEALLSYFKTADWSAFDWERDAETLRDKLWQLEAEHGISEIHRYCSQQLQLLAKNSKWPLFKLLHRYGHVGDMVSFGLSPDGKYLASGSWVGEDYEAGGELMIWEVANGRCVNILDDVNGGVGWPDYAGCLKWSPNGQLLGMAFDTNGVGTAKPFADAFVNDDIFYLTDGWSRPPQWCWHPEGKALYVSCWDDSTYFLPGNVAPLDRKAFPLSRPYGFLNLPKGAFSQKELDDSSDAMEHKTTGEKSLLSVYEKPGWSSKGYLFGHDNHYAFTQDPQTRTVLKIFKKVGEESVWSPDGSYYMNLEDRILEVYDANFKQLHRIDIGAELTHYALHQSHSNTENALRVDLSSGKAVLFAGEEELDGPDIIYWHPNEALNLFAVIAYGDNGYVVVYQNFKALGLIYQPIFSIGSWELGEAESVSFSQDGRKMAVLSPEREVSLWQLDGMEKINSFHVFEKTKGIMLGANDILIAIHDNELAFYNTENGEQISHYQTNMSNGEPAPDLSYSPLGRFAERFDLNPAFPLADNGDIAWGIAFSNGLLVAAEGLMERLDEELSYTINNRLSWPFRWAEANRVSDLNAALDKDEFPFPDAIKKQIAKTLVPVDKSNIDRSEYFMSLSKKELFGKNTKKNGYTLSDNSGHFWNDTKNLLKVDQLEIPLKKAKNYKATTLLKGTDINEKNLKDWVGKVVLFIESYSPSRVQVGIVFSVDKERCCVFNIDFNDRKEQGSSGSSNASFEDFISIGLAEPR